jgi:hypothetical protein
VTSTRFDPKPFYWPAAPRRAILKVVEEPASTEESMKHRILALSLSLVMGALAWSQPAEACGIGVHMRLASKAYEIVAQNHPEWAAYGSDPLAMSYLWVGAVAPDLEEWSESIDFGHELDVSLHLLDESLPKGAYHRMFALGHLSHAAAADAACDQFWTPTVVAAAAIGALDLFEDWDDPRREALELTETLGDFVLGDWDAVVDTIYDFYLESGEAKMRLMELFLWYCQTGREAVPGSQADCFDTANDFGGPFAGTESFFAGLDRDGAKAKVAQLVGRPLDELLELFAGGYLGAIIGLETTPSAQAPRQLALLQTSSLSKASFWATYEDQLDVLASYWTLERYEDEDDGWPMAEGEGVACGNLQSVMARLPVYYDMKPTLIVDRVTWSRLGGQEVEVVAAADAGKTFTAEVSFYSAVPFNGTVRGIVRTDKPGLTPATGTTLGEAEVYANLDPISAIEDGRQELQIMFTADIEGADGFVVELFAMGSNKPFFTTSWDRLWLIKDLEFDWSVYQDHFGTYGHWPPSLPVAGTEYQGLIFGKASIAPAGGGIKGAKITLDDGAKKTTNTNGLAVFDKRDPGEWSATVSVAGYEPADGPQSFELPVGGKAVVQFFLHANPGLGIKAAYQPDRDCIDLTWKASRFGLQAEAFLAWATDRDSGEELVPETDVGKTGQGKLCRSGGYSDGQAVMLHIVARYTDATLGVEDDIGPVVVDGSSPIASLIEVSVEGSSQCVGDQVRYPEARVSFFLDEPHTPVSGISWRIGGVDWRPIQWTDPTPTAAWPHAIELVLPADALALEGDFHMKITNGAGLETRTDGAPVPTWSGPKSCGAAGDTTGGDATLPDGAPANDGAGGYVVESWDPSAGGSTSDGCSMTRTPAPLAPVLLLIMVFVLSMRRRLFDLL